MAITKTSWSKNRLIKRISDTFLKLFSLLLIVVGAILIYYSSQDTLAVGDSRPKDDSTQELEISVPEKIFIPKISKSLEIEEGKVSGDRWTVSEYGVSYLASSANLNEGGNTVLYGHNKKEILGGLTKVEVGDLIFVQDSDGEIYEYEVRSTAEIKPSQVEILAENSEPILTIYTCSGFLDTARFVVIASKVG